MASQMRMVSRRDPEFAEFHRLSPGDGEDTNIKHGKKCSKLPEFYHLLY